MLYEAISVDAWRYTPSQSKGAFRPIGTVALPDSPTIRDAVLALIDESILMDHMRTLALKLVDKHDDGRYLEITHHGVPILDLRRITP